MSDRAYDMAGNLVLASDADPHKHYADADGNRMVLCRGPVCRPYFARKSAYDARRFQDRENAMSEWHLSRQQAFPEECREILFDNGRRGSMKELYRSDVLFHGTEVEFQHSPMSADEFRSRNAFYLSRPEIDRIFWVFDLNDADIESMGDVDGPLYRWRRPSSTLCGFVPPEGDSYPVDDLFDLDDTELRRQATGSAGVEVFLEFSATPFAAPTLHRVISCGPSPTFAPSEFRRSQFRQRDSWESFDSLGQGTYWNDWTSFRTDESVGTLDDLIELIVRLDS